MFKIEEIKIFDAKKNDRCYTDLANGDFVNYLPSITEICSEYKKSDYINDSMILGDLVHNMLANWLMGGDIAENEDVGTAEVEKYSKIKNIFLNIR